LDETTKPHRSPVGVISEMNGQRPGAPAGADSDAGSAAAAPDPPALRLAGLRKRYGASEVVRGVDLVIEEGELLTLLGPSGSGKTTVLKLVAGFTEISGGAIYLRDNDISRLSPAQRGIGMVFQNYALFPHMTVAENIGYGLKMQRASREARAAKAEEMLELVGLPGFGGRLPRELSGGQQQRVALARALAFGPSLLLMDEPLGALDRELRERMMVELRRIHQEVGVTALYVTHDREEALVLSDRIGIMRDGNLEGVGTPAELLTTPPTRFIASFFGGHALLPATVIAAPGPDGHAAVSCLGQQARVRCAAAGLASGAEAALVLPASALTVGSPPAGDSLAFDIAVADSLDLGDRFRITAEVLAPDGSATSVLVRLTGESLRSMAGTGPAAGPLRMYAEISKLARVA
jgi:ABC-type Fe3+/spermidine/putrescine transport system ATPase subunit